MSRMVSVPKPSPPLPPVPRRHLVPPTTPQPQPRAAEGHGAREVGLPAYLEDTPGVRFDLGMMVDGGRLGLLAPEEQRR